jgi:hypothetical protein
MRQNLTGKFCPWNQNSRHFDDAAELIFISESNDIGSQNVGAIDGKKTERYW